MPGRKSAFSDQNRGFCALFGTGILASFCQGMFFEASCFNDVGCHTEDAMELLNNQRIVMAPRIWISKSH